MDGIQMLRVMQGTFRFFTSSEASASDEVTIMGIVRHQAHALRASIIWRLALLAMLLVGVTALLALGGAWTSATSLLSTRAGQRVAEGDAAFAFFLSQRGQDLVDLVGWLKERPDVASYAQGAVPNLGDTPETALRIGHADFIAIRSADAAPVVFPGSLAPLVQHAWSAGAPPSSAQRPRVVVGDGGTLFWSIEAPLPDGGSVLAGDVLGHGFADSFKAWTGLDLILYFGDRVVATSLTYSDGQRLASLPLATETAERTLGRGLTDDRTLSVAGTPYQTRAFPLYDGSGQLVGTYLIGLPAITPLETTAQLVQTILPYLAGLMLLVVLVTLLMTRKLLQPLRELRSAMVRMAAGDLDTPVTAKEAEEMVPFAKELDYVRRRLRKALGQLAIEKSLYQGIFYSMADGVFTYDREGRVTSMNPAARRLLPMAADPAHASIGDLAALQDTLGQPLCENAGPWLWMREAHEPVIVKGRIQAEKGEPDSVEVTIAPIKNDTGETVGLAHVVRDITAQEELQRLKDRFLMNVAHELRTPVASMCASVEALEEEILEASPEDRTFMVEAIQRGAARLQSLVANLLDLGNIQAGRFTVKPQPIGLETVINEAVSVSQTLLTAKEQDAEVQLPQDLPKVLADPVRTAQVVVNLVANASKYSASGDHIVIAGRPVRDFVEITVSDHGPGIPRTEQDRLFDYYYQGREAHKAETGFGLGLAIVKGIIDAHGGRIGVASEEGKGTTFWFTLQRADSPEPEDLHELARRISENGERG